MPGGIPAIITAILGAVSTGVGLYEATQKPGLPKISATPPPLTTTENRAQQASVASTLPNLQSLTGGSLSPEYAAQYGAGQAGVSNDPRAAGNIMAAINQYFGLTAPGQTGFTPGTTGSGGGTNVLDLLTKATPGATPPFSGGPSDEFKGLAG